MEVRFFSVNNNANPFKTALQGLRWRFKSLKSDEFSGSAKAVSKHYQNLFLQRLISFKGDTQNNNTAEEKISAFKNNLKPEFLKYFSGEDIIERKADVFVFAEPKKTADALNKLSPKAFDAINYIQFNWLNNSDSDTILKNVEAINALNDDVIEIIKNGKNKGDCAGYNLLIEKFNASSNPDSLKFLNNLDEDMKTRFMSNTSEIFEILKNKDFNYDKTIEKIKTLKETGLFDFISEDCLFHVLNQNDLSSKEIEAYKKLYDTARSDTEKYAEFCYVCDKKFSIEQTFKRKNNIMDSMKLLDYDTLQFLMSKKHMCLLRQSSVISLLSNENIQKLKDYFDENQNSSPEEKLNLVRRTYFEQEFENTKDIGKALSQKEQNDMISYLMENDLDLILRIEDIKRFHLDLNKIKSYKKLRDIAFNDPFKYGNGSSPNASATITYYLFDYNTFSILAGFNFLDFETMQLMMTKRVVQFQEDLHALLNTGKEIKTLIKKLMTARKVNGMPLTPQEKVDIIPIVVNSFKSDLFAKISEMADNDSVDLNKVTADMMVHLLSMCNINDANSHKMIDIWPKKYIPALCGELTELNAEDKKELFKIVINKASQGIFEDFINDITNKFGLSNEKTKEEFESLGINYQGWINPNPKNNVNINIMSSSSLQLSTVHKQIIEDIEELRKNKFIKKLIDNVYSLQIVDGKFTLPDKTINSKSNTAMFLMNLLSHLKNIFDLAQKNKNHKDINIANRANKTLMLKEHLLQRLNELDFVDAKNANSSSYTVKMWDRNPVKDLFQGHYSTCCLRMGGGNNGSAMPVYLLYSALNMVEVFDNKKNTVIGNAVTYLAKDEEGRIFMILDNIEINKSAKGGSNKTFEIKQAITQYCKNILNDIAPTAQTKVLLGVKYNDVDTSDNEKISKNLSFIGNTGDDKVYLDVCRAGENDEEIFKDYPKDFHSYEFFELN